MILWHKDLIKVLPRTQLLRLLRDCIRIANLKNQYGEVIASDISNQYRLSAMQVNDYDIDDVLAYTKLVCDEIQKRLYQVSDTTMQKVKKMFTINALVDVNSKKYMFLPHDEIFKEWHNIKYLQECYCVIDEMCKREIYSIGDLEKAQKVLISAITQEGAQVDV